MIWPQPSLYTTYEIRSVRRLQYFQLTGPSYPGRNAWEALVLVDQQLELSSKFDLLRSIGQNGLPCAIGKNPALQWSQRGHVLNHQETQFVTCLVKQLRLNFDLCTDGISM